LFNFTRLPFRVVSATSIFQRIAEGILKDVPGVSIYIDNTLVMSKNTGEHLKNLEEVLTCMERARFRLKKSKCSFMLLSVEYLGYRIRSEGLLHPTTDKIKADPFLRMLPPTQGIPKIKWLKCGSNAIWANSPITSRFTQTRYISACQRQATSAAEES